MAFPDAQSASQLEQAPFSTTPLPKEQQGGYSMNRIWNVQHSSTSSPDNASLSSRGSMQLDGMSSSTTTSQHTSTSSRASVGSNFESLPAGAGFPNYAFEGNVSNAYSYYLDRGNGQFTRLIPADMLPPMKGVPSREEEHDGMVILQPVERLHLQSARDNHQVAAPKQQPSPLPDNLQNQIDCIVATSPKSTRRVKIYCDKWIHEGVCAFTQQGCKFKHEMPRDEATQRSLGLFHGFPAWWRKRAEEQNSPRRGLDAAPQSTSPARLGGSAAAAPFLGNNEAAQGRSHHPSTSLEQQRIVPPNEYSAGGVAVARSSLQFNVGQRFQISQPPPSTLSNWTTHWRNRSFSIVSLYNVDFGSLNGENHCREAPLIGGRSSFPGTNPAVSMDNAIATLNSLADLSAIGSPKKCDTEIRGYIAEASSLPRLSKQELVEDPRGAFEVIDPAKNSIGYFYVIDMVMGSESSKHSKEMLADKIVHFLTRFDPVQIRYVGTAFRHLLDVVASRDFFPPAVALELLTTAILRLDPTGTMFTSTHVCIAKMAVESNILEPALEILDKDITCYPVVSSNREAREARDPRPLCDPGLGPAAYISTTTGLTESLKSSSVLEYNYFRYLAYSSRRDWPKAFAALEQVITHPAKDRGVSKVMAECHKRWILVGLLNSGKMPSLPSYTAAQPTATYNSLSAEYKEVASLFVSSKAKELKEIAENNEAIWQEDGTTSLVVEVLSAFQKWQIINLRKVFTEVSIGQIRRLTCSAQTGEPLETDEDVSSLISGMLSSGMLNGTLDIDSSSGSFLKFGGAFSVLTEEDFAREIATSHARITALNKQYKAVNDRLSEKKEYVKYMVIEQKRTEKEGPDAGVGFDSQIEDEDLMTGIMTHG